MGQPDTLLEGKYEILNKIREGGMGAIYRVRHRLLEEIRVIKVMRAHVAADEDLRHRFLEEARTATRLKHPNICTIYDFALDDDGTAYLVMEFIEGINLAELLALRGRPSLPLTLEIAHQALLALSYLHRKSVIHRDIAPDNLMLTRDEEDQPLIKLIDLGIAKTADRATGLTATGVFLGKLRYASPEQYGSLHAGERLDGRSDLYSLGVVLYELSTGQRPFSGESPAEMLRGHVFNPPLPFSESDPEGNVPPELRAVILKALEKKREDRHASAEELDREILSLRKRHSRPEDLRHTREILSTIPRVEIFTGKSVTPSAQDRLDRQFGPHTTARSSEELATVVPTVSTPEKPVSHGRRRAAWIAASAIAAAALLLLWRPWSSPSEARRAAVAPTRAPIVVAPRPAATIPPQPQPTAPPTAEPAPPTAPPPASPPPSARLREAADDARGRSSSARQSAERVGAPRLAAEAYERARTEETEARRLAAHGQDAAAARAFGLAARLYAQSETSARRAPAPSATPAQLIASGSGPTPRLEATRAVAAPAPPLEKETAPATAATASAVRPASDQERIRETVHRYEQAQSTLDADLYSRIFPSADRARIQQAFESFRSQSVQFEVRRIQIDPGGTRADVYGYEKRVAVPRAGSEQRIQAERVMHLEKRGDGWVITGLK